MTKSRWSLWDSCSRMTEELCITMPKVAQLLLSTDPPRPSPFLLSQAPCYVPPVQRWRQRMKCLVFCAWGLECDQIPCPMHFFSFNKKRCWEWSSGTDSSLSVLHWNQWSRHCLRNGLVSMPAFLVNQFASKAALHALYTEFSVHRVHWAFMGYASLPRLLCTL